MRHYVTIVLALFALAGCAKQAMKALDNVDKDCVRHYTFSVATGLYGMLGNVNIAGTLDCQPSGTTTTTTVTVATPKP